MSNIKNIIQIPDNLLLNIIRFTGQTYRFACTCSLFKRIKDKKRKISKLNLRILDNRDWSKQKEPSKATVFSWNESEFEKMINQIYWGGDFDIRNDGWISVAEEYHTYRPCRRTIRAVHNRIAMWLHNKGAKHGDLVLSPSRWWDNVDNISNVYRIYTMKQGTPTIELIGSDIARYLNEDGWDEDEPIIGFSSSTIKYSLGPNYPVGYWGGVPDTQGLCGGGGDGDFLRLEPVAAKNLYIDSENPVDVTVTDLSYENGFSTLNFDWGGLQFPGEPNDVVRQLKLYHKYENYLREKPNTTPTSTDTITEIWKHIGLEKQQIYTHDGDYIMSHQPETLWNYGLNNSYDTHGRILFTYRGKAILGQPIGRVLRLRDICSNYEDGPRLSVWDEVITIDNAMESLKDQLVKLDTRWTICKLDDIPYTELYTMVNEHPINFAKRLDESGFEDE
tara:strand:- start:4497 stop:5837 length:1341 start_codon:yes stop_codon:yes gene_type:complete